MLGTCPPPSGFSVCRRSAGFWDRRLGVELPSFGMGHPLPALAGASSSGLGLFPRLSTATSRTSAIDGADVSGSFRGFEITRARWVSSASAMIGLFLSRKCRAQVVACRAKAFPSPRSCLARWLAADQLGGARQRSISNRSPISVWSQLRPPFLFWSSYQYRVTRAILWHLPR